MKKSNKKKDLAFLRQKAEDRLKQKNQDYNVNLSNAEILKLLHELEVYQIELELQNEDLFLSLAQKAEYAEKYHSLYDFAPSGYFTLSNDGIISEMNFAAANMIGKEKSFLINKKFEHFVSIESKETYKTYINDIYLGYRKKSCEIRMSIAGEYSCCALLHGIKDDKSNLIFLTVVDITNLKAAEEALQLANSQINVLFNSSEELIIFSLDKNYCYTVFNEKHVAEMKKVYGVEINKGMNMLDTINNPELKLIIEQKFHKVLNGESFQEVHEQPGMNIFYQFYWNPIFGVDKEIIGISCFVLDISQRIQNLNELKKHKEHLEDMVQQRTAELEEKNKELERYNKLFEGREFRIKELREKLKDLEAKLENI
jgi:PAS domain S-box-containing protein